MAVLQGSGWRTDMENKCVEFSMQQYNLHVGSKKPAWHISPLNHNNPFTSASPPQKGEESCAPWFMRQ